MPNWVSVDFVITGDPTEMDRFRRMMFRRVTVPEDGFDGKEGEIIDAFDFGRIIPMPAEAASTNYEEWAVAHWNSKWNAQYFRFDVSPGHLFIGFETPWAFPLPVLEALAAEFPALIFDGHANEESGMFHYGGQFNGDDDFGPVDPPVEDDEDWGEEDGSDERPDPEPGA